MNRDTVSSVTERPAVDYAHLPGEEQNPLMESTAHVDWGLVLLNSVRHTLAGTDCLVTGNVAFAPSDGAPHTAPDLMVIPGAAGREFGRYEPGADDPLPSVCVEILSPSNTAAEIRRRCTRLLRLGVPEVYVLDPRRETVVRVELDLTKAPAELSETSAIGAPSPGLKVTFALAGHRLAVCCPAGRMVRPGDDPFGWLVEETNRADQADRRADAESSRADAESSRADAAIRRADEELQRAEAEAVRADQAAALADRLSREYGERIAAMEAELERLRSG
jgi:Uma2 family endonuclease